MNIRFSVGEIAEFYQISRQTVLFYDKQGVFKPKMVDEKNHYRYYTPDQLEELDTILMLKNLGFSLKEIRVFMANRGTREAVDLLKLQKERLEQKIAELTLSHKRVEKKAEILSEFLEHGRAGINFCEKQEEYLITEPVESPYQLLQADIAIKRLMLKSAENARMYTYLTGTIIAEKDLKAGRFLNASHMFFPLTGKTAKKDCIIKPAGVYARAYHTGTYEAIGRTYKKIVEFIETNNRKIGGNSYEYCILDNLTSDNPNEYVTEIQIPVLPRPQ